MVAVITRWPYYRGGRKAGFHCFFFCFFFAVGHAIWISPQAGLNMVTSSTDLSACLVAPRKSRNCAGVSVLGGYSPISLIRVCEIATGEFFLTSVLNRVSSWQGINLCGSILIINRMKFACTVSIQSHWLRQFALLQLPINDSKTRERASCPLSQVIKWSRCYPKYK